MNTVSTAVATTWRVDSTHSLAEFAVRHLMISTVKGRFTDVTGTLIGDVRGDN
jgi:polyisoprenoid-binding protein YceI